jgi:hypothetical protein
VWGRLRHATATANRAGGGLWLDVVLYAASALFAWWTVTSSTLAPHRAWGAVATVGYAAATVVVLTQLAARWAGPRSLRLWWGAGARTVLAVTAWTATALLPLVIQAVQRAGGRADRAQEEVLVIEDGGRRLLETGSPYLDRAAIAALAADDRLLAYMPYQPGMAVFGIPRALDPSSAWWSDARVWFALVTGVCLALALILLRRAGVPASPLIRALQVATVLPVCALTLATGGNDIAVLALCLLALALAATHRLGWAGLAVGAAAALKLFAWPVAVVVGVYAITRSAGYRYAAGALGVPILTALPVLVIGPSAMIENVLAFPFGKGLVISPAASPLPGHLIATSLPGGSAVATVLLVMAGVAVAVVAVRRPPRTAAAAARLAGCGLLAAFLLLPATRFGYLLYPAVLLVWAAARRVPEGTD